MKFHEWSKKVGWEPRNVEYPQLWEISEAVQANDMEKFLIWKRFLKSPSDEEQKLKMKLVINGFEQVLKSLDL